MWYWVTAIIAVISFVLGVAFGTFTSESED